MTKCLLIWMLSFTAFHPEYIVLVAKESNEPRTALILTMIAVESGFNHKAVSPKKAVGLMQVLPSTAEWVVKTQQSNCKLPKGKFDLLDRVDNVQIGSCYFKYLMNKYKRTEWALAAYNAGPGRIDKVLKGTAKMPKETDNYVTKIFYKTLECVMKG